MKKVLLMAAIALITSTIAQTSQAQTNRNGGSNGTITFEVVGRLTHKIEAGPILRSHVVVLMEMVKGGVRFQITTHDSVELNKVQQLVRELYVKLPGANFRVFKKDENNLLITTGKRHAPTHEELQGILNELKSILSDKTVQLGLTYVQDVRMR